MTDLVTDAAIDAASEAVFANRGLSNDPLIPVLTAAAPHIAAEALRQAARLVEPGSIRPAGAPSTLHDSDLLRLADLYEREEGEK